MNARINLQILVDRDGKPTGCEITQTFNNTDFEAQACGIIMKDAVFRPARDKDGQPVDSYYATVIVYRMG